MNPPKLYRVTRRTKTHVWVKWDAYGYSGPRGLSNRMTTDDFKSRYLPAPPQPNYQRQLYYFNPKLHTDYITPQTSAETPPPHPETSSPASA